jgi:peptidoglycan/LPS O-acetylase OafA/YrhL
MAWGKLTLAFGAALAVEFALWHHGYYRHWFEIDAVLGLMVACLIGYCVTRAGEGTARRPLPLRLCESRFALGVGAFSYSLYLIHVPLLAAFHLGLLWLHLSGIVRAALLFTVGPLLAALGAYLFYLAFERPFLTRPSREAQTNTRPTMTQPNIHHSTPSWPQTEKREEVEEKR